MHANRTKLGTLRINSPEWHKAWQLLADTTDDTDRTAEHPETREVWEYVGSVMHRGEARWSHEFRHRTHPRTERQWVILVPASQGWRPGDLSGSFAKLSA